MKTLSLLALAILLATFAEVRAADQEQPGAASPGKPDSAIVSKLRELIAVREQLVQNHGLLVKSGRASGVPSAAVALAKARIELAREMGDHAAVIAQWQEIVKLRRDWVTYVRRAPLIGR